MTMKDGAKAALDRKLDQMGRVGQIDSMTENVLRMRGGITTPADRVLGSKFDNVSGPQRSDSAAVVADIERRAVEHMRSRTPSTAAIATMMHGRGARPDPIGDAVIEECYLGPNGSE